MLEGNPFADLVPGSNAPSYIPAMPKQASPPQADKPGEAEGRELVNEARRLEIEAKRREEERLETFGVAKVEERRAAGFLGRMINSHSLFAGGVDTRSPAMQQLYDVTPENFSNAYSSTPEQRAAKGYIEDFIRAKLRLESGAAIGKDELAREYPLYFPMPNDTEADFKRKKGLREQAIIGMKAQAGAAAPDIAIVGGEQRLGGGEILPSTAGSMGEIPRLEGKLDLTGLGPATVPEGQMPTTVEPGGNKPVLGPDGKPLLELSIDNPLKPEDATADQRRAEAYRAKQERFNPLDPRETLLVHGMSGTLSDEAAGVGNALAQLVTGNNPITGYRTGRDAERMRIEDARDQLGGWGTAAEIGGGFLSFNPMSAAAPAANVLAQMTQGAKGGAVGGGIYGFGSGEGFSDSLEKGAIGSVIGGVVGAALPAAGALAERGLQPRGMAPDLAAAARQEQVRLRRPMFDEGSRIKAGNLESATGSAPVIQRAMQETAGDIEAAAARTGGPGNITELETAGGTVQNAGRRFIQRTKGVADRLYNRARSLAGPDATVTPREGLNQLRRELQDLRQAENVNAGEIEFINDIGADLTNGPLTVDAIRAIRQGIRGRIDEKGLTSTQADARAHRILDSLHTDISDSLPSAAATAFRRADTYYRERMTHIDDILERFIGNTKNGQTRLSGEAAFKQLKTMASPGGDGRRLAAMWRDMTPDEQADVAATLMRTIGRRGNDPTDATAPFSVDLFISQAATLSPSAKRTIFGPSGAESVTRLVNLSRSLQQAGREINRSKSGATVKQEIGKGVAAMLLGGGGGAMMGGAGTAGLAAGGALTAMLARTGIRNLSARALMSPRISGWLADVAQATTPAQVQRLSNRLGVIASREPALAGELGPLQEILQGRAAAPGLAEGREDEQ